MLLSKTKEDKFCIRRACAPCLHTINNMITGHDMATTDDACATKHHPVNGAFNTVIDLSAMNEPVIMHANGDHCLCTRQWGQSQTYPWLHCVRLEISAACGTLALDLRAYIFVSQPRQGHA